MSCKSNMPCRLVDFDYLFYTVDYDDDDDDEDDCEFISSPSPIV